MFLKYVLMLRSIFVEANYWFNHSHSRANCQKEENQRGEKGAMGIKLVVDLMYIKKRSMIKKILIN